MIETLREVREAMTANRVLERDANGKYLIVAKLDALIAEVEKAKPVGHFMRHGEKYVQCVGEASYTVPLYTAAQAQPETVAYLYPGSDIEPRSLAFSEDLDDDQRANCLPLRLDVP